MKTMEEGRQYFSEILQDQRHASFVVSKDTVHTWFRSIIIADKLRMNSNTCQSGFKPLPNKDFFSGDFFCCFNCYCTRFTILLLGT